MVMPGETMPRVDSHAFVKGVHGVRYQVKDVARSVAFYTQRLGFTLEHQQLPAFASVSLGGTQILLSGPGASGSRPLPDGQTQEPGGWNRVVLKVSDLPGYVAALKGTGLRFRNDLETGPGGRQIQIEDGTWVEPMTREQRKEYLDKLRRNGSKGRMYGYLSLACCMGTDALIEFKQVWHGNHSHLLFLLFLLGFILFLLIQAWRRRPR